jgi:hypothetical protein
MSKQLEYLKSKKRLSLCILLAILVVYTIIGNFPKENKILALVLVPFCLLQLNDWVNRQ